MVLAPVVEGYQATWFAVGGSERMTYRHKIISTSYSDRAVAIRRRRRPDDVMVVRVRHVADHCHVTFGVLWPRHSNIWMRIEVLPQSIDYTRPTTSVFTRQNARPLAPILLAFAKSRPSSFSISNTPG